MSPVLRSIDHSNGTILLTILAVFMGVSFLILLVQCACCTKLKRRKKEQLAPVIERKSTRTASDRSTKESKMPSDHETPSMKTILQIESVKEPTVATIPVISVITPKTKTDQTVTKTIETGPKVSPKKNEIGPKLPSSPPKAKKLEWPFQPVRYDDPAYRTLGRDVDDPFGTSVSLNIDKQAENKAITALAAVLIANVAKHEKIKATPAAVAAPAPAPAAGSKRSAKSITVQA